MAITDMAMAEKINKTQLKASYLALATLFSSSSALAGEWRFAPSLGFTETYTDNVELSQLNQQSSFVSQFIIGANASFSSKKLQFSFAGTETIAAYSHDSELNDDYQTLQANGSYSLWQNNLKAIGNISITNISKNENGNSLADLITADTVQQRNISTGLEYNSSNSDYQLFSSLISSVMDTEDDIGESHGYTAIINSENGSAARYFFWQVDGSFSNRESGGFNPEQGGFTSENYQLEAKLGAITSYKLSPFIRVYNERVTGTLAGSNPESIPSWGPGLRYQAAKHFIIDLSYNYVEEESQISDDYMAANINWQPSARTSLKASYSKRFFGDYYQLDFSHSIRRLTNRISYNETIEAFDRNNYQGSSLEENNEYTLNKRLSWLSQLTLSRTTFTFDLSNRERESLSSNIIDNYLDARFSITRNISSRGSFTVFTNYSKNIFDKENPDGPRQEDTYKTLSATFNKSLASSLNTFFTLQYLDRKSNFERYTYTEARISINLTKDF